MELLLIIGILIAIIFFLIVTKNMFEKFQNDGWDEEIDAFIYINLEKREDRKKEIADEFEKLNIPQNKIYKVSGVYMPKNGHKGCVQSHILALKMAKLNKWKKVIIFEDDMTLNVSPEEVKNQTNRAMKLDNWDLIMLGSCNLDKGDELAKGIFKVKHATCGTAYLIKDSYIDTLIELFEDCNDHMLPHKCGQDGWEAYALDQQWNKLIEKDNWISFDPILIIQRNSYSTTNGGG
jgi:hypothetical protein